MCQRGMPHSNKLNGRNCCCVMRNSQVSLVYLLPLFRRNSQPFFTIERVLNPLRLLMAAGVVRGIVLWEGQAFADPEGFIGMTGSAFSGSGLAE